MSKKTSPPSINQTAIGNDNIQVVGSNNVITRITNFFAGDTEQQRTQRNRQAMLELVNSTWIKDVLEKSLFKEDAHARKGIFMIDATSRGFMKDGPKNRLRAQDIHKIVDVFNKRIEVEKYSNCPPWSRDGEKGSGGHGMVS